MVQVSGFSTTFSAGEIGPDAWERSDIAQHAAGCALALNCIGLPTGPNYSRPGTIFCSQSQNPAQVNRLVGWDRDGNEGLVLEFSNLDCRVWTARGAPVMDGASQVAFAQPYSAADLPGLRFNQVGDIAIITSRDGIRPLALRRYADNNWSIGFYLFQDGPWLPENTDESRTITLTDLGGGTYLLDASAPIFAAGQVNGLFRIFPPSGQPGLKSWAPNTASSVGANWISNGRVYENVAGTTTGNTIPIHERGTASDGGVEWKFLHDGACVATITEFVSATQVKATILGAGLPLAMGTATSHWAEGAYSDYRGWPTSLAAVAEERLALGGTLTSPTFVDLTRTAGFNSSYADFKPGLGTGQVLDDDAVRVSLGAQRGKVIWLLASTALIAGTSKGEYLITGGAVQDPIAPASTAPRPIANYGSADVMPVLVQGPPTRILHMARGATVLRELTIGPDQGTEGRDLSLLAQHIFGVGVVEMVWQQPDSNLWMRLLDGSLAVMTYHIEHGVLGARRQELGGGWKAESLCVSPDNLGRDRLHLSVVRTVGGTAQRQHWVMALRSENIWTDGSVIYEGAATSTLTGLAWANGETLTAVADGAKLNNGVTISGGVATLPAPAASIVVGYPMTRRWVSLPLDMGGPGSMLARNQRVSQCTVVLGCVTAEIGVENQEDPETIEPFEVITSRRPGDSVPILRRTRQKVTVAAGADRDPRIVIQTSEPYDLQIYAIRAQVSVNP